MSEKRSKRTWLRRQRGASLPLALLLTLVCAMAASVVIAASTAAVGRVSNLAESEQAYYSTTSAVNLFRDNLKRDHTITVAVEADTSAATPSYRVKVLPTNGQPEADTNAYTLLERAAMKLLFGEVAVDNTSAQSVVSAYFAADTSRWADWPNQSAFSTGKVGSFELEHSSNVPGELDAAQKKSLEVNIDAALANDGSLVFSFRKLGEDSRNLAVFTMSCDANYEFGATQTSRSGTNYEIKYVTITWMPSTIEKGSTSS